MPSAGSSDARPARRRGVPLGYVSKQLGHADVGATVRHYARYVSDERGLPETRAISGLFPGVSEGIRTPGLQGHNRIQPTGKHKKRR